MPTLSLSRSFTCLLTSQRLLLVQQYQGKDYNPADRFTISPDELELCIQKLRRYFSFVMQRVMPQKHSLSQHPAASRQQQPPPLPPPPPSQPQVAQQASSAQKHPLNAENLQQQQAALQMAHKASLQKHHGSRDSRPPAAPTTSQPPFPIGAASPHGIPQAYGPTELTQDKLKFPPAKKRKGNQGSAASTPTPAQAFGTPGSTASPQLSKLASPQTQRQTGVSTIAPFKCPVQDCEQQGPGFASQTDLDRHVSEVHETKEAVIENPLSWALEGLSSALGLDVNRKRKAPIDEVDGNRKMDEAPKMEAKSSRQGETPNQKQEAGTPATGTTTPMARPSAPAKRSPRSQPLTTPQATAGKTPAAGASGSKPVPSASETLDAAKALAEKQERAMAQSPPPDAWADSMIRPEDLLQCFEGLDTLHNVASFSNMQASLTPASTLSGSGSSSRGDKKDSPRESDISENDQLQISIATAADEGSFFNPFGLADGLMGDFEELGFDEDLMSMDWDKTTAKGEQGGSNNRTAAKRDGRDQWAPAPTWDVSLFSME